MAETCLLLLQHRRRALVLCRPRRPSVGAPLLPLRHHLALLLSAQLSLDHGNLLETALFLPLLRAQEASLCINNRDFLPPRALRANLLCPVDQCIFVEVWARAPLLLLLVLKPHLLLSHLMHLLHLPALRLLLPLLLLLLLL